VPQHRQADLGPRTQPQQRGVGPLAEVLAQHRLQVIETDATGLQRGPVAGLGEVGLTAEDLGPAADGLVEGEVLEGVQGVVMDEDADRALCREQMGGVLSQVSEPVQRGSPLAVRMGPFGR
jgi:hypothetical protein